MAGDTCQFFAAKTPKGNDFFGTPADVPDILGRSAARLAECGALSGTVLDTRQFLRIAHAMDHEAMDQPLLRVRGLEAGYGDVQVLWGIDLDVARNSIVAIVGPNGAGKTTLLSAISGMVRLRSGSVHLDGKDLTGCSPDAIVSAGISHVPEGRRLFRTLNVRDNLLLGAYHRVDRVDTQNDLELVLSMFPILRERAFQDASTLSGGEQQMCAIGRGIMARPKLLIIDELSLGLAPAVVETLAESLPKIRAQNLSVLLVEQDVATAFEISDYGYVMESGRVALHGRSADLLARPDVRDVYLGIA
jgi:branched-chain amino acid transport system ATP-binding protein